MNVFVPTRQDQNRDETHFTGDITSNSISQDLPKLQGLANLNLKEGSSHKYAAQATISTPSPTADFRRPSTVLFYSPLQCQCLHPYAIPT